MDSLSGKVIIATRQSADSLEALRKDAYRNSQSFKVIDEEALTAYSRWSQKDESGIVLIAVDQAGEALATLRGNVRFTLEELAKENTLFADTQSGFCCFPALDLTFAATSPHLFYSGLFSVLRYYIYVLHRHSVRSVVGTVVQHSSSHNTLERFGYDFRVINYSPTALKPNETFLAAQLPIEKIDPAIDFLSASYREAIKRFPMVIS